MKKTILIITIFVFYKISLAQKAGKQHADSLIGTLSKIKNDTLKIKSLNTIALVYVDINTDTAQKYADLVFVNATKLKWKKAISAYYTICGNIEGVKGNYEAEKGWVLKALSVAQELKDTINLSGCYNNLGTIEQAVGNYVQAIDYYAKSLQLGQSSNNNYMISIALENISSSYFYHKNYTQALQNSHSAIYYKKISGYPQELLPNSYLINANCFRELNMIDSADFYYNLAIEGNKKTENTTGLATALSNHSVFLAKQKKYSEAIDEAKQAEVLFETVDENFETAIENKALIGNYYLQLSKADKKNEASNIKEAFLYLTKAKEKSTYFKNLSVYTRLLQSLAEVNAIKGNYKAAYELHKEYKNIEDSVFSQENKNQISNSIAQISIDKKNSELQLQQAMISNQRRQKLYYIIGLCALGIIGGLLYYQSSQRKKTNTTLISLNNQLDEANKIKATFFGILSHDLRSPIASLVNFLQLQKNEPKLLSDEQKQFQQEKIKQSAEALLDNMETMLLWSKSQMQHFAPQVRKTSAKKLFAYISSFFSHVANIEFIFIDEQNIVFETDENYLQTIMHNLTANSIKAIGDKNNGKIKWQASNKNGKTILSITDNGEGINKNQLEALQKNDTPLFGNKTGFGFHIIKDLAKAINCDIDIESNKGTGSTFTLAI